jgi:hypothetical protein
MKAHRQDAKTPRTAKPFFVFLGALGLLAVIPFAFPMKGLS